MIIENYINKIGDFLKKRLAELVGICIVISSLLLFVSLISYSPEDPNYIFPDGMEIKNFLGFREVLLQIYFFNQ